MTMSNESSSSPSPRALSVIGALRWALVAAAALAAAWSWGAYASGPRGRVEAAAALDDTKYQCPMHPQIVADRPGECPICHMALQPFTPGHAPAASSGARVPGAAPVTLPLDRAQSIGMRTALVEAREGGGTLRVTASVTAPEQGAAEVHARAAGFVERIAVRETGIKVSAGQELLGLYSPDVFQAESELVAAKAFGEQGARAVAAGRQRLELLGMSARAIDAVLASGKPERVIAVTAPAGGYVSKKSAVLGSYVTPEMALYEIVDLSKVYVVADVFQRDAARVRVGTEGRFTPTDAPEKARSAKVDLVYPRLDADARTTRVRLQVSNDGLALRPGQYGNVEFAVTRGKVLVVPRDAVVDTGRAVYVFVDEGGGRYTPRPVSLGDELGDGFEVLGGLTAGERVVAGATFLVDAESRLQGSRAP